MYKYEQEKGGRRNRQILGRILDKQKPLLKVFEAWDE